MSAQVVKGALCASLLAIAGLAAAPDSWKRLGVISYDWDGDGQPERFILDIPDDWKVGGEYSRLRVLFAGRKAFVLRTEHGWSTYDPEYFAPRLRALGNRIRSEYLLFVPFGTDPAKPPLLILTGYAYGSSPGSLHVITLEGGFPQVVFSSEEFDLTDYADLDGDGFQEVIGKPCFSEEVNGGSTYDPFLVYTLPAGKGKAVLSILLSKAYNVRHYYGWAGPACREDLIVFTDQHSRKRIRKSGAPGNRVEEQPARKERR